MTETRYPTIRKLVTDDDGFMGSVARGLDSGLSYDKVAENAGHKTTMPTFIFLNAIKVLTGRIEYETVKKEPQKQAYYKAKKWCDRPELHHDEKEYLLSIIEKYERDQLNTSGHSSSQKSTAPAYTPPPQPPQRQASGVYVYSYSLYLNAPVSPQDGRTLFKVGASHSNTQGRVESQQNSTPVPDDITLLRIFECSDAIKEEKKFHRILSAAGHLHQSNHGGKEWFLTSLELIDAIAETLGLFDSHNEK